MEKSGKEFRLRTDGDVPTGDEVYHKIKFMCEDYSKEGNEECGIFEGGETILDLSHLSHQQCECGETIVCGLDKYGWVGGRGVDVDSNIKSEINIMCSRVNWWTIETHCMMKYTRSTLYPKLWYSDCITRLFDNLKVEIRDKVLPTKYY